MTYVGYINNLIKQKLSATPNVVCVGQNIAAASCLGGLTRGLPTEGGNLVINTTNSEYTMTGVGFGLMTQGVNGIFFLKQQDFLLLGIDHLVHTWNALRTKDLQAGFTIFFITVDNGFEGPQSCINNLPDLCSISHIPGFTISSKDDAESIIDKQLVAPGVRFISVSQKLFKTALSTSQMVGELVDPVNLIHRYGDGENATIVSTNFAFTEAARVATELAVAGIQSSLFNVPSVTPTSWGVILRHAQKTRRVLICDDSKSQRAEYMRLAYLLRHQIPDCRVSIQNRVRNDDWSWPNADLYEIEVTEVLNELSS
jgi:pyruvate/2-oxoglutarate/acetoin dehydrogenase E1 component